MTTTTATFTDAEFAQVRAQAAYQKQTPEQWLHDIGLWCATVLNQNNHVPVPPVTASTWYDQIGLSITGASPADVALILKYGRWCRTGYEDCWDPTTFKAFMLEAKKQGLKVLSCVQSCAPRYVGWTAARYAQFGAYALQVADLGVDAIEAGNEPNLGIFNGTIDAQQTVARGLALAVSSAVRSHHPGVPIISAGWSPMGSGPPPQYPQEAIKTLCSYPEVVAAVDGYGYHPYEMSMLPSASTTTPGWNACFWAQSAWQSIVAKGNSKPLWFTEFGYHGSDIQQASWLRDYFATFSRYRKAGMKLGPVFVHTLHEGDSTTNPTEASMGILRGTVEKPAAVAIREIGKTAL